MQSQIQIIDLNASDGKLIEPTWLEKAEKVHRQLRPKLPTHYTQKMEHVFTDGGRMCVAVRENDVVGVAVYRIYENTADGVHLYVDDLITDETKRSSGVGKALMDHLQTIAHSTNCERFTLDSGTWRHQAHKFYFREGLVVTGFHFGKEFK